MKTKLFFLFSILFFLNANAQIVNIPDARFKQILLTENCVSFDFVYEGQNQTIPYTTRNADLNGNGEIEVSEVEQVKFMFLNFNNPEKINSLEGIKYFKNLVVLNCGGQYLNQLDLSGLSNLKELICYNSQITSLNLTGVSLDLILANQNYISSFDFNAQNQLRYFDFTGNNNLNAGNITLNNMPNLYQFTLESCNVSQINISNVPKLEGFNLNYNPLPNLDLTPYSSQLKYLSIVGTGRTSLDVSMLLELKGLYCSNNNIVNLDVTKNLKLEDLICENCNLSQLDITKNILLKRLNFSNNSISQINSFINYPFLWFVGANNTLISDADFSNCKNTPNNTSPTMLFECAGCSNLEILNIKNGVVNYTWLQNTPKLKYVCIDDNEIGVFNQFYQFPSTVSVNSYCSFNLGGNHNTITGNVKLDSSNNGCDTTDANFSKIKLKITKDGQDLGTTSSNLDGNFELFTDAGNFTITPILENSNYYTVTPSSATVNLADANNNVLTQNFCVTPIANKNDLDIEIIPKIQARPGFDSEYQIIYKNKGTTTLSGNVLFAFNDDKINYISSDTTPNSIETGKLYFNFTDLKPFEEKTIKLILKINPPTDANFPVNGGDILSYSAQVFPIADDETPRDNTFALRQEVVNSVDPNDKTCLEGDIITPDLAGNDVHYLIRFENVGTANAVNVVVKDMIDTTKFDVESLQPIKSSHPYRMTITEGNKVEFFFENIQLPFDDANNDGYILFKIKTKPTLVVGDTFSNKADIYFDYNFPIATNEAITTVQNNLSTQEISKSEISIYPNPVKDILTFKTKEKVKKAEIYDTNGRLVKVELGISNNQIDVSSLKTGTYVIKVISDKKYFQTKFIKK